MHISAVVAALPQPLPDALRHVAALGFTHVDLLGMVERPAADLEALADTGLLVSGVALGQGLQVGEALDVLAISHRRAALEAMKRQVADAALLGAGHAFVPGCRDDGHQGREVYEEACRLLAEFSACRMVRLCVDSLAWVERIRHENVGLVLHVPLLGDADPADIAREAGKHLAALRIRCPSLPEEKMRKLLAQLTAQGYRGAAALEPAPGTGFSSWREGKAVLEELLASDGR